MDVLQVEMGEVMEMWNTHIIRQDRSRFNVGGVPDELFFIPEMRGSYICDRQLPNALLFFWYIIGYVNQIFAVDPLDVAFCKPHTKEKPLPVPPEFVDLADILMRENGWSIPDNCEDALKLYVDLLNCIE